MFKQLSMVVLVSAALTACGGSDNKKSSSSAAASSMPASVAASSMPASVAASSTPASVAASSMPASVAASSTPASVAASSMAASSAASNIVSVADFEGVVAGTTYASAGWAPDAAVSTVVSIASVIAGSGLPANGNSVNVLRVVVTDYNSSPVFNVTIPAGKTLADYNVKVDAYFPYSTLGLTTEAGNYYKDFLLIATTTITGALADSNANFQSKFGTEFGDVDVWKTFTLSVDATKGAALTGAIQIGLGINRPKSTEATAYYFDNVRLEAK